MTYNIDEGEGVNHFNCPVVAYYPELLKANMSVLADGSDVNLIMPYFDISSKKHFLGQAMKAFAPLVPDLDKKTLSKAIDAAFAAQDKYFADIKAEGERAVRYAKEHGKDIIVLIGRPYHIDPEINHGIDKLIASFGLVIITEDVAGAMSDSSQRVNVLNQWTYHARLYNSARYAATHDNTQLVQLVSFGCGIDAITTDEVREIMERAGKLYTQIKIDEINNLGAARIRIRSMLEASK
jgi:predicted nucleotide-binding protein (sugar kinase/HSP70/actin superfamily)